MPCHNTLSFQTVTYDLPSFQTRTQDTLSFQTRTHDTISQFSNPQYPQFSNHGPRHTQLSNKNQRHTQLSNQIGATVVQGVICQGVGRVRPTLLYCSTLWQNTMTSSFMGVFTYSTLPPFGTNHTLLLWGTFRSLFIRSTARIIEISQSRG